MYSTIQIASWFYCKKEREKKNKQKYYKLSQLNQPNRNINLTENDTTVRKQKLASSFETKSEASQLKNFFLSFLKF